MLRTTVAILVLFVSASLACAQSTREELEKLAGEWTVVSAVKGGKAIEGDDLKAMKVIFHGKNFTIKSLLRDDVAIVQVVDPSKTPGWFDFSPIRAGLEAEVVQGIYKLEGDTLIICFGRDPKERPADFATGATRAVLTLKKDKQ